jgi:CubicO group peptidase (beta-lactamase class C family)
MGSISIFKEGKEVYQNCFGYISIEEQLPIRKHTKFRIGSISKTFTATIIKQLVEQDKLTLDTKLEEFYPEIPNAGQITITHLLKHRSGIYNFTNAEDYPSWMESPLTKQELIEKIITYGTVFEPGEKTEYSNSNFVLLSFIIEDITGQSYARVLHDYIIEPCDLKNTCYGSEIDPGQNEALSYNKVGEWELATETDMSVPLGAGGIVSTPYDLNTFLNQLFNHQLVSHETLAKMMDIQEGIGMGLLQVPFYEKKAWGHTGGIDGFQSNAFYFPGEKVSITYLSNGVSMPMNDILIGALSIYFGKEYELPEFKEALQLTPEELDKYLGIYSSPTFPLKLTITKKDNILIGQGTGQPSFPLEAYDEHKFKFDQASLKIEFLPDKNKLIVKQGGGEFELTREE